MKKEIFPFDIEWTKMVLKIMQEGGCLWVVERTDTNQFLVGTVNFQIRTSNHPVPIKKIVWQDTMPCLNDGLFFYDTKDLYPSKELAEKFAPKEIKEGGCGCCGHGSVLVPIKLTEHEFVPSASGQTGT